MQDGAPFSRLGLKGCHPTSGALRTLQAGLLDGVQAHAHLFPARSITPSLSCPFADLDLESKLWLKIRLAPMCPWIGTLGLGFVGSPSSECAIVQACVLLL